MRLTPGERMVLLVLRFYQAENNKCWPAQSKIAEDSGLTARRVCDILRKLENLDLVKIVRKSGKLSHYSLRIDAAAPELSSGVKVDKALNCVPRTPEIRHTREVNSVQANKERKKNEERAAGARGAASVVTISAAGQESEPVSDESPVTPQMMRGLLTELAERMRR